MNDVPPSQEPADDDIATSYRRASALDPSRPSAGVTRAILAHATLVSAERALQHDAAGTAARRAWTRRTWLRAAIFGTLAAAAVAGLLVLPNVRTTHLTPQTYPRVALPKATSAPQEPTAQSFPPVDSGTDAQERAVVSPRAPAPLARSAGSQSSALAQSAAPQPPPAPTLRDKQSPTEALASGAAGQLGVPTDAVKAAPEAKADRKLTANELATNSPQMAPADAKDPRAPPAYVTVTAARKTKQDAASGPVAATAMAATAATPPGPPHTQIGSPEALLRAAETGDVKALRAALDQRTDINSRDEAGRTALLLATLHGQTKAVSTLLAHGADPNAADSDGMTPLQAATNGGKPAIIKALKHAGAH